MMLADTLSWWRFWKYLHLAGAFGFLAAHGATAAVAFRLRREREPERIRSLLDLSAWTRPLMYWSLLVLIVAGVGNGFVTRSWGRGWIWTAIALLTSMLVIALPLAVPYYRAIRRAVDPAGPGASPAELEALLSSSRPVVIALVETLGLAVILWLMVYKPF